MKCLIGILLLSIYGIPAIQGSLTLPHHQGRASLLLTVKGGAAGKSTSAGGEKKKKGSTSSSVSFSSVSSSPSKKGKKLGEGLSEAATASKKFEILEEEDEEEDDLVDEDDEVWGDDEDEEEEDEEGFEDDEEEEEEEELESPSSRRSGAGGPRRKANDWHYADRRRRLAAKKTSSYGVYGLVKGAAKFTGNSMSKMVGLFQPNKYVGLREVVGAWKMKQKISERPGELERCEATVEIRKDGSVATFYNGKEMVTEFLFKDRQWPRLCTIEFEAKAFQGLYDREPQLRFYKGYARRSMMNPNNIRIEGKIYDVQGTWFLRQKKQVGKFRALKIAKR